MIRITRVPGSGREAYKIFIDDICHGKIETNETKEFEVERGNRTVCVKSGWFGSPKLEIVVDDSIVELVVGKNPYQYRDPGHGEIGAIIAMGLD